MILSLINILPLSSNSMVNIAVYGQYIAVYVWSIYILISKTFLWDRQNLNAYLLLCIIVAGIGDNNFILYHDIIFDSLSLSSFTIPYKQQ